MKLAVTHRWDLATDEAKSLQVQLAEKVIPETTFDPSEVQTVAGVDVSFPRGMARAAIVVLGLCGLEPVDYAVAETPLTFPYVPGLLTFREGPSILAALAELKIWPDLLIFDGQGQAHPRRMGLAAHMGVILDQPSIGCAKSRLIGRYDEPGLDPGDRAPLYDGEEIIGQVVRTRARVKPVFVSIGHRVDLETATDFVLRCTTRYRLPETTRLAHRVAGGAELDLDVRHQGMNG